MRAAAVAAAAAPAAALAPPGKLPGSAIELTIPAGTFSYTLTPAGGSCGAGPHPLVTFWHARLMSGAAVGGYSPLIKSLQDECYTVLTCMDRPNVKGPDTAPWVLDSIDAFKKKGHAGTDFTRVGVAGHSMGGGATVSALDKTDGSHGIKCGVGMHPWMQVAPGGAANVKIPLLFTTGSTDALVPPPEVKKAYGQARGPKAFAEEKGAGHMEPLSSGALNPWVIAMMNCHLQNKQADCDKVYKKSGWDGVTLSAYESVPPSGPAPPPAPPAPPRYHCDAATNTCTEAADGHSTIAKCRSACAPPPPSPPASSVYACVVAGGARACQAEPAGFPGAYPTLTECETQCPSRLRTGGGCYVCVMPATGCEEADCTMPGTYPSKSACVSACPVAPAPPAPPTPAVRYHCDPATYTCAAAAEGHSSLANCQAACVPATPPPDPPMPPGPPAPPAPPAPGGAQGPGAGKWTVSTPEAHGLASAGLKTADKYIGSNARVRDCLVVVKDGEIVYESGDTSKAHQAWSMTKTLGALLVGVGVRDGKIDVDADITKAYGVKSPKGYPVTSAQIMAQALAGSRAGQKFKYDTMGTKWIDHLAKVVNKATGSTAGQTWRTRLAKYLGLEHFSWADTNSLGFGSSGSCRDFARIGQLLLNKGAWKAGAAEGGVNASAVQLLPTSYVEQLVQPHKWGSFDYSNPCYGYLTWLNADRSKFKSKCVSDAPGGLKKFPAGAPHDMYLAAGFTGEVTLVIPSHNAVVVSMGTTVGISGFTGTQIGPIIYEGMCKGKVFGDPC